MADKMNFSSTMLFTSEERILSSFYLPFPDLWRKEATIRLIKLQVI